MKMSKILLAVLLITVFILGMNYQKIIEENRKISATPTPTKSVACTMEVKICPGGTPVGRVPPDCEFAPCLDETTPGGNSGQFCGGIAGTECPEGYICQLDGNYPDAAGICINRTSPVELYECPKDDYVDCMPGPDKLKSECNPQYLQWAQENCPNFKGAAY